MSAKHTPGQLRWVEGITSELYAGGKPVMTVHADEDSGYISFENRADKARLVACWNGCLGINPAAVPVMLKALKRIERALRSDGQHELGMRQIDCHDFGEQARAAIAKAVQT